MGEAIDKKTAEVKKLDARHVYRLTITDELILDSPVTDVLDLDEHSPADAQPKAKSKARRVFCTYHNGKRIHGKNHGNHPPVVLSASDQDEVLWIGEVPFRIDFERISGTGLVPTPFYRDSWNASKGHDGMFRIASGPPRAIAKNLGQSEYKFTVTRQVSEGGPDDPSSEPLDPHIIVEP